MVSIHSIPARWHSQYSHHIKQPLAIDLLNPSAEAESKKHKLKRLVQSPNSYFMDVKCPGMWIIYVHSASMLILCRILAGCFSISTVFSHAQTVVICSSCSSVLCQPTGGRARLTEGKDRLVWCSFRTQRYLHQGAHTVEKIEWSWPCIHPTRCLHYSLRSAYTSFRLSCGWPQM
jgi:small subunit ribosomal protein S27e